MNAAPASLERRAISLGSANALDYALQFLLPIVLTRTLDPHSFGEYRLLWLAIGVMYGQLAKNAATAQSAAPRAAGDRRW